MCGIAGFFGESNPALVKEMTRKVLHRGPDDEGYYTHQAFQGTLGHCRLSIIDLEKGRQPLLNEDAGKAILVNGEIYNFARLREELEARHQFVTNSDSESALHLYEEAGPAAVERMDGMFALALADGDSLFLARDPLGIKPLYIGLRDESLVFGSELKALAGFAGDIREFPPGAWFHSKSGFHRYYELPEASPQPLSLEERLARLRRILRQSVQKRLVADVPVGAFLSGGLDSSIIAALASQEVNELHTFSVGVEGSSDLEAARRVAEHLDTVHHEYCFTVDEVFDRLPGIIYHLESFDRDLVQSAIPCYFAARLASENVKVVLTGEGADELFAGYDYYKEYSNARQLEKELRRCLSSLHHINLQRVDRLTMMHSIEARVPFLDLDLVSFAQNLPVDLKIARSRRGTVDKWLLRKAFEQDLPEEIVWREKEQFDQGSGTSDLMCDAFGKWMSQDDAKEYKRQFPEDRLCSPEECLYHKILRDQFSHPESILANVARWNTPERVSQSLVPGN